MHTHTHDPLTGQARISCSVDVAFLSTTTSFSPPDIHSRRDSTGGCHSHKVGNRLHWQHPDAFQSYALPFPPPTVSPRIESMPISHKTSSIGFFTNDSVIGPSGASPVATSSRPRSSRRSTQAHQSGPTLIVDVLPSSDAGKLKNDLSHSHATRRIAPMQYRSLRVTNPDECNRVITLSMNCRSRLPMEWMIRSLCKTLLPGRAEEASSYSSDSSDSPPSTGAVEGGSERAAESPRAASWSRRSEAADSEDAFPWWMREIDEFFSVPIPRRRRPNNGKPDTRPFPSFFVFLSFVRALAPHAGDLPSVEAVDSRILDTHARWKGAELKKGQPGHYGSLKECFPAPPPLAGRLC